MKPEENSMVGEDLQILEGFWFTLGCLLEILVRWPDHVKFGLVHIDVKNARLLGDAYGAQNASHKLHEVLQSLRREFRKTDVVARDGEDFWILVPHTPATEQISGRAKFIVEKASQNGLEIVERDISIFLLTRDLVKLKTGRTAAEFLAHLKLNHAQFSIREEALPACV
jgi:GGDEF domain-containing protein